MAKGWSEREEIPWDNIHTGSEPVDPGIYAVTVEETEAKLTDSTGKPSIAVEMHIFQKYDSDEELDRKIFDTFTVTTKGGFKMKQFAEIANLELPSTNGYDEVCDFAAEMKGMEIWALVGQREYNKRVMNQVDRYLADDELEEAASKLKESRSGFTSKRTIRRGKSSNGAKDTEEIKDKDDKDDNDDQKEQKPKKARMGKRRRAQT